MTELPSLNDEQVTELAKSAAHSYALSQESMTHRAVKDYIDFYIEAFAIAHKTIIQRLEMESLGFKDLKDSEKLPSNKLL